MADRTDFEARLAARLRVHAARSDRPIDATGIAAAAVATRPRQRTWQWWRWSMPPLAPTVLLVLALLAACAAAAILSGQPSRLLGDIVQRSVAPSLVPPSVPALLSPAPASLPPATSTPDPSEPPIQATDPHTLLVVSGRLARLASDLCTNVARISTDDTTRRGRVVRCAGRVRITDDGSTAAVQGSHGLDFIDLRTGTSVGSIETGRDTWAIAWSPSGRWLQWEACKSASSGPCTVIYSARDGSGRHELYRTSEPGYVGFTTWSPDEAKVSIPTGNGPSLIGDADGSDLRAATSDDVQSRWTGADASMRDRSAYIYLWGPPTGNCTSMCVPKQVDVMFQPIDGGPATNLTNLPPGDVVAAAALSPDGRSVAFLKTRVDPTLDLYTFASRSRTLPAELWVRDGSGHIGKIDLPALPRSGNEEHAFFLHWSPDGSRVAIEAGNGRSGDAASIDTYLVPLDGSPVAVLTDARESVWSPDGTQIAFVHERGPAARRESDPIPARIVEVAASDGSGRRQIAVLNGDSDGGYFVWATK